MPGSENPEKLKRFGKPPINLIGFALGAFIVGIVAVILSLSLLSKGGTDNIGMALVGIIGAVCCFFVGAMSIVAWRYLRQN